MSSLGTCIMDNSDPSIAYFPDNCIVPKSGNDDTKGYAVLWSDRDRLETAHRLSYRMFIGPIPNGMVVISTCENRVCINPKHLILGTTADVAWRRAKYCCGEKSGRAKLTEDMVRAIRESDMSCRSLGDMYGVSKSQISTIRKGKSWKHVKAKPD